MSYVVDGIAGEFPSLTTALKAAATPTAPALLSARARISSQQLALLTRNRSSLKPTSQALAPAVSASTAPVAPSALAPPKTDDTMRTLMIAGVALLAAFAIYKIVTR